MARYKKKPAKKPLYKKRRTKAKKMLKKKPLHKKGPAKKPLYKKRPAKAKKRLIKITY